MDAEGGRGLFWTADTRHGILQTQPTVMRCGRGSVTFFVPPTVARVLALTGSVSRQ